MTSAPLRNQSGKHLDGIWVIGLICLYLAAYLTPLAIRPLARPDEVRYGEIAREMIVSGDWVSPHLNGVRYFEKPIMGHWLNAGSLELFGTNAFALRLPTALAVGLTVLLIFLFGSRFANRRAALLASGIYLTTFEILSVGTAAVLDSYLTLFLTAAIVSYYFAHNATSKRREHAALIACGLACGCAFLTKGFLGLLLPAMVAGGFLILQRSWRTFLTSSWIPILVTILVVLPWAISIHYREPDFWRYFIFVEHIQRFMGDDAQHAAPWWYYIARLPLAAFPWLLLAPLAWKGLKLQRNHARGTTLKYLICWAVLPFLFFSLAKGKLMTYVLPCFVPFSILLAMGLERAAAAGSKLKVKLPAVSNGALLLVGLAGLLAAQAGAIAEPVYSPEEWLRFGVLSATLIAAAIAVFWALRCRKPYIQFLLVGCAVVPLYAVVHYLLPNSVVDDKAPGAFFASLGPLPADSILISDASLFGSLGWFAQRSDIYVVSEGEIAYGLSYPDQHHRSLSSQALSDLIAANSSERELIVFVLENNEHLIRAQLPGYATRTQQGELVLWRISAPTGVASG